MATNDMHGKPNGKRDEGLELGAFVRGLAHDIANPLNAMAMNAELAKVLLDRGESAGAREVLQRLLADCARCGRLVQSFQRFGAALQKSSREIVDVRAVIENAIRLAKNEVENEDAHFNVQGGSGVLVAVDAPAFERACAELLRNAIEAGANRVTISMTSEHGLARISIADNGAGIPVQTRDKVVEPFYSTRRAQGASGLGLTLAHELLRQHGGTLTIHSDGSTGTTIDIALRVAPGTS